jgi:hypothetical protein
MEDVELSTEVTVGVHVNVNGFTPEAVTVAPPVAAPKQLIELEVTVNTGPAGFTSEPDTETVHCTLSRIITL